MLLKSKEEESILTFLSACYSFFNSETLCQYCRFDLLFSDFTLFIFIIAFIIKGALLFAKATELYYLSAHLKQAVKRD